jgi:transcriptional regulator with XRE-family HTH domain
MKRVHRNLSRDEVEGLRERLSELVPMESAGVAELLRMMRLIARKSQAEYARMCGGAPRVLTNIEGGIGSPTVETLEKLVRPFGFQVGVVMKGGEKLGDGGGVGLDCASDASALSRALQRSRQRRD